MNTARGFFHLIRISLTVFATICPFDVAAESANAASSIDDLFRKAGISKISLGAAADFALRDLSGNTVTLGSYRGSPVLLNFWATWCGPCREEMPSMERLHRQLGGQGLTLLAINQKESVAKVANFYEELWLDFPSVARHRRQGFVRLPGLGTANNLFDRCRWTAHRDEVRSQGLGIARSHRCRQEAWRGGRQLDGSHNVFAYGASRNFAREPPGETRRRLASRAARCAIGVYRATWKWGRCYPPR